VKYVYGMDENRITKQALKWSSIYGNTKRGRPRKNWKSTVLEDLKKLNMDWDTVIIWQKTDGRGIAVLPSVLQARGRTKV